MATMEINGKHYEVTGIADDGLPIIKAEAVPFHHKDEQGSPVYDNDGNPKISVNINVPAASLFAKGGEQG